ncbi:MAG: hypothetical protein IJ979_05565 [Tidjanibacter sp.]|nr:hypothetical protein [Tidjanibacter sp.]MBR4064882.1 hypothetical protein [Tidjanibacter sp.]MBR7102623.1 hypothetical protein [Tidjanibacter sp.]
MKWTKYVQLVLMLCGVAVFAYFLFAGEAAVGAMLTWAYIILGLALASAVVFPLISMFSNPKGAIRTLVGLVVAVAAIFGLYSLSSASPMLLPNGDVFDNVATLKLTDTGLYIAYIVMAAAFAAILFGELKSVFKK